MRKPKAGRKPVSPLRRRSKIAQRSVPNPTLEWLFQRMADSFPGLLCVVSWSKDRVCLKHKLYVGTQSTDYVTKSFTLVLMKDELVEVRVRGISPVLVSLVPSAVIAVALR